jgi:hypothetical protein
MLKPCPAKMGCKGSIIFSTCKMWIFMRYYLFFRGRMELLIPCLFFIGIRELKVRQIDYNIIFGW